MLTSCNTLGSRSESAKTKLKDSSKLNLRPSKTKQTKQKRKTRGKVKHEL